MNTKKNVNPFAGFYLILVIGTLLALLYWGSKKLSGRFISESQMETLIEENQITNIVISQNREVPTGKMTLYLKDGSEARVFLADVNEAIETLKEKKLDFYLQDVNRYSYFTAVLLPVLLIIGAIFLFTILINHSMAASAGGGANSRLMNFGKSNAKRNSGKDATVTFKDVAGLEEEKENLAEVVDFLRFPKKYLEIGARIPKGVLLVGPPGTGKTLLARAVSGEAGVPFFSISGSDFVEMFVGVGAARVRDLFEEAKKSAPSIVFIDEIDAVARRRGTGMGGGHDEREQTLNQLLVEMDGFGVNEGVIVMAATNRVDILDPAIMRPGRFDRKVMVGGPDRKGRRAILDVHARNKRLGDDVDLDVWAQTTIGYTGAELSNLMNEAAILAAKNNKAFIGEEEMHQAFIKISIGTERKSLTVDEKARKITAYHEAGHAILFHLLPLVGPVHTVSIIPTGLGAGGYTFPLPEKDEAYLTRNKMLQYVMACFGGRIAEELVFQDVTSGAVQDIKDATRYARAMVMEYGMSERAGMLDYASDSDNVFIGRDITHMNKAYSETTAAMLDEEIRSIVDGCYQKAREILQEKIDVLHRLAAVLLEKEKIERKEFEGLFSSP